MSLEGKEKILVLSLNPFLDIQKDFRLSYLISQKNIEVDYLYKRYIPNIFYRMISFLWGSGKSIIPIMVKIIVDIFKLDLSSIIDKLYDEKWVKGFFINVKPKLLAFDHVMRPGLYNTRSLMSIADIFSIPTIDFPHGIPLYINHPKRWDKAKIDYVNNQKTHIVLHHKWWKKELINCGLNHLNTPILGSARFCKEWKNIIDGILPEDSTLKNIGKNKFKVVYMDLPHYPSLNHNLNKEAIKIISDMDFVSLIVKPQTRKNRLSFSSNYNFYTAFHENSVNLIKWADAVVVLFSSIMLEVLNRDKVFLYPKYMHDNEMIHEQFNACWTLNSHQDLIDSLTTLRSNPNFRPYTRTNVDDFMQAVVYNGPNGDDVLSGYNNYITKSKKEFSINDL